MIFSTVKIEESTVVNKAEQTTLKKSLFTAVRRRLHRDLLRNQHISPLEMERSMEMFRDGVEDAPNRVQERQVA